MSFTAVAIASGIGALGSVASGLIGSSAAKSASQAQAQAAQQALAFQKEVFEKNQQNVAPFIGAGTNAIGTLGKLNSGDFSSFQLSPDYQFALQQGTRGVTNYENSQGMGMSGGALKDIAQFNQGLATQNYGNYYNRLMGLAQLGGNAASGLANTNTNAATGVGNTMQGIGQAQASGTIGSASAWMGGIGNATNNAILGAALGRNPSAYQNTGNNGNWTTVDYGGQSMPMAV